MPQSPFPQGTKLPGDIVLGRVVTAHDEAFWIHATRDRRRVLLMTDKFITSLTKHMRPIEVPKLTIFSFGDENYHLLAASGALDVVERLPRPRTQDEATPFARALAPMPEDMTGLIYCDGLPNLLSFPDDTIPSRDKAAVLGLFLSGGVEVSADDIVALQRIVPKMEPEALEQIVIAAGITPKTPIASGGKSGGRRIAPARATSATATLGPFVLPGRQALSDFFNEHVVDIVADEVRYAALGIGFPGGIILEGPTGCGKTFAVERLIEHLGWSSFAVEASSIASPYIHETSRKVAEIFSAAIKAAPSVIVIDEMDAFLASRDTGSHHHQVEEVAEFLRRIPEASANRVLVIGMTNQVGMIDPAILRRGRFDHVIHVDHAGRAEIAGLLTSMLASIPNDINDVEALADQLAGRPLSDVSFVVREAGRLAARRRKDRIGDDEIAEAQKKSPSRDPDDQRRIGF